MQPKDYDSTLARIAGNIAAGLVSHPEFAPNTETMHRAVWLARDIIEECRAWQKENDRVAALDRSQEAGTR